MSEHELSLLTTPPAPDAQAALLEALNRGREEAGYAARSAELWRWRTRDNPDGVRLGVARVAGTSDDSPPAALVLGVRHAVRCRGETVSWLEITDVFNDFARGAGLARAGAFLALGRAFAEEFGGHAPEKHPVMYGLPDRRAHRLGRKHLGYEVLRSEYELRARPDSLRLAAAPGVEIEEVERIPDAVSDVFVRVAEEREALLVRDAERLDWRYTRHPERAYQLALARRRGELLGFAVYRRDTREGMPAGLLADWLVAPGEDAAASALLEWAASRAAADEAGYLAFGGSDKKPEWGTFQAAGFRVHGTKDYIDFRSFQRPYIMSWLVQHWSSTLGDTERG